MSEVEKQEGQKTVVAFITGLLIGGLLVWVFSSTPDAVQPNADEVIQTEQNDTVKEDSTVSATKEGAVDKKVTAVGDGKIVVEDQKASASVSLTDVTFPTDNGWVVVRDYMDGVSGNILGAARYSVEEGLMPKEVALLRSTEKGSSYQVVFFTESGDKVFSLSKDTVIDGVAETFKAN